ncbi:hypothetical protein TFLX_06680 [Thermoflexales bacterium]|nr:hypothetical protein TFLX_06680 [Thermoflexales bacterium]
MRNSRIRNQFIKIVASILIVALICSPIPPKGWASLVGVEIAQAAPASAGPASTVLSNATLPLEQAKPHALPPELTKQPGQPAGMLLEAEARQTELQHKLATLVNPISISRVQSAYTPELILSNILAITLTVTNNQPPAIIPQLPPGATLTDTVQAWQSVDLRNDPNAIHNVLLVDSFASGVVIASSMPRADYRNEQYTWNLGDIAPLDSVTVTIVMQVPASSGAVSLDTGATAWGTLQDHVVSAQACPIMLLSNAIEGQSVNAYLRTTLDAGSADEYVIKRAGQMCPDPVAKSFEYVRSLGYEAYKGSLRGARGTLWSEAGNSLDKSSLLIATLRSNGVPARYRHGTLSDERAQELILSMFPPKPRVVGYFPTEVEAQRADPAHDPKLLAEAKDHWWVEAYQNGTWIAMDPSFSYAAPGQTFTQPEGDSLIEVPDQMRHKVTVSLKTERYDLLTYLLARFVYVTPLTTTFNTAELVGQPLTFKQLVSTQHPPFGCLIYCWTHFTYIPYLRMGDEGWMIQGEPYWELLSDYPFGQFVITAEWLIFDVRDADGNVTTYTREIADRVGIAARKGPLVSDMVPELLTGQVMITFGPKAPALVNEWDTHAIYFNPSLISSEYAAHVGENLLAVSPRILSVQPIVSGLGSLFAVLEGQALDLLPKMEIVTEVAIDSGQAFNRMQGATFVALSDQASREVADTSLVRSYPDSPRITMVSSVISRTEVLTQAVQLQLMDLVHNSLRVIAYPGQVKSAEPTYRLTRGMNEAFLEKKVGEQLTGETGKSGAGVLQAATAQNIPLMYVDLNQLEQFAQLPISQQAKARIVDAVTQGNAVLVPERMVLWNGQPTIAWWQINLRTGEVIDVSEDGTHQWLVIAAVSLKAFLIISIGIGIAILIERMRMWEVAARATWEYFWKAKAPALQNAAGDPNAYRQALIDTKNYMRNTVWPSACDVNNWLCKVLY